MHDDLLRALHTLDLAPGANWRDINARFRHLTKVWHPDKFFTTAEKEWAEAKLVEIIAARELLDRHYRSADHQENGYCICWGTESQPPPVKPDPVRPDSKPPPTKPQPQSQADSRTTQKTPKPDDTNAPWDWVSELAEYFDLGAIKDGEPAWLETFRRSCAAFLGKHPGDTALEHWGKPPAWTRNRKMRSLIIGFFLIVAFDKVATFARPTKPPQPLPKTALMPRAQPEKPPPLDLDSPAEIERERRYFEAKWKEREDLLIWARGKPKSPPGN